MQVMELCIRNCRWCLNFTHIHCLWKDHSRVCFIEILIFRNWFCSVKRLWCPIHLLFTCRYGGGMSSAKAALESDTRVCVFCHCIHGNILKSFFDWSNYPENVFWFFRCLLLKREGFTRFELIQYLLVSPLLSMYCIACNSAFLNFFCNEIHISTNISRSIAKPCSKSHWIHWHDDWLLFGQCPIAERIAGR